jgi:hypothetical protein
MDTPATDQSPHLVTDTNTDFIEAVSLCAEIEGMCGSAGALRLLPYVGMARTELTDGGARLPARYRAITLPSLAEGIERLEELLTILMSRTDDLFYAVRLYEAREILREGTTR